MAMTFAEFAEALDALEGDETTMAVITSVGVALLDAEAAANYMAAMIED